MLRESPYRQTPGSTEHSDEGNYEGHRRWAPASVTKNSTALRLIGPAGTMLLYEHPVRRFVSDGQPSNSCSVNRRLGIKAGGLALVFPRARGKRGRLPL